MVKNIEKYDAESIQILDGLEAVRKRPAMYIGSTSSKGLHHLVYEVLDNAIDEAMGGYCDEVTVTIERSGAVTVTDNGRGIPTGNHPVKKISTLTVIMTTLHSGGKFDKGSYAISGGLHGVGLAVVNALSEFLEAKVHRNGKEYSQKFMRGSPVSKVEERDTANESITGSIITFKPDIDIFDDIIFDYTVLRDRCRELAYLNKGLTIKISDKRPEEEVKEEFSFEGGIKEMVKYFNKNKTLISGLDSPIYVENAVDGIIVEVSLVYNTSFVSTGNIYTFANNIRTVEGGTHLSGFKAALTKVINYYGQDSGLIDKDKDEKIEGIDTREGTIAVVSVKVPEPQFEGQTKTKLGNANVKSAVFTVVYDGLKQYFLENPEPAKEIVDKCLKAAKDRVKLKKQRDALKKARSSGSLPGKLADCSESDPKKRELFIVEGDSAGGSAKQGRYRTFQAILPLRGKIINAEKASMLKLLRNKEITAIIKALGTGIDEDFTLEDLRYEKIILMMDADVDGAHIKTLLLTFFFRHMRELIDTGYIYVAVAPLFKVNKGRKSYYAFNKEELAELKDELNIKSKAVQRFKGLGEMNAKELRRTTMDPEFRRLVRITIENISAAENMVSTLMGDNVEVRREFIEENAATVDIDNLDI